MFAQYCSVAVVIFSSFFTANAGEIQDLGTPVKIPLVMRAITGIDQHSNAVVYFNCAQTGEKLFLLQANPESGEVHQFNSPTGGVAWGFTIGPSNCVYLGACENGSLLKFDPAEPQRGIQNLGKPSASESYLWNLISARDGNIYGCTYPHAKLVRYNPRKNQAEDLGSLDPVEMYARSIAESTNGLIYIGIGTARAQVIQFDPETNERKPLVPERNRPPGTATVTRRADGNVYVGIGGQHFRCTRDALVAVQSLPPETPVSLPNGATIGTISLEGDDIAYDLLFKDGKNEKKRAHFDASAGVQIFTIGVGPKGKIYGSSVMPLGLFEFAPKSSDARFLGGITGGETYSFTTDNKLLYICSYPNSVLTVYDPTKPWNYGSDKKSNPRDLGRMGDGHLRPRAMIYAPDKRIYVGSLPPYGQIGGALGIYDPKKERVVENYRNIVTNQGINALCYDPVTEQIFGGSSIGAGGGARAVAKNCALFAFNPKEKRITWEQTFSGDTSIAALVSDGKKIHGIAQPSNTYFVLNPRTLQIEFQQKVPFAAVREISLGYDKSRKKLFGLAAHSIFSIDPQTHEMKKVASIANSIDCGFALTDTGIYFGINTRLMRYAW